jgi:hypothetical protein
LKLKNRIKKTLVSLTEKKKRKKHKAQTTVHCRLGPESKRVHLLLKRIPKKLENGKERKETKQRRIEKATPQQTLE